MSADEHLNKTQFPVYESDDYTTRDYEKTTSFGVPMKETGQYYSKRVADPPVEPEHVPVDKIRATQSYVFGPHVRNLASVPASEFERVGRIPDLIQRPDGMYNIDEGHHRVAAARMRGDSHVRANVWKHSYE